MAEIVVNAMGIQKLLMPKLANMGMFLALSFYNLLLRFQGRRREGTR